MKRVDIYFEPFGPPRQGEQSSSTCNPTRILMLHGHGQSGRFFYYKTTPLVESIKQNTIHCGQSEDSGDIELYYPNGTLQASEAQDADVWAWGYGDYEEGCIFGLEMSIKKVMDILDKHGPFVGIVGFSTGAAIAAIVASLMERQKQSKRARSTFPSTMQRSHPPFRFAICFSGFKLGHPNYQALYEPKLRTPMLHFIAELDTMIPRALTEQLVQQCFHCQVKYFMGTHYVPRNSQSVTSASHFMLMQLGWSRSA
ncbi:serine hydrolase FSH [Aspergillus flavus]|uniref:Serine hydrolase FSH n=1 Tax=Aspergillus flavus TaxID=5059 RepID=A0A5N6GC73_ASPFL|nr:serine hydrolase FSH [Aspergillus flavus]